ncbi:MULTISPECIES: transposase [unclassified Streptomyces]|uniref:transposase n=1 Tax=unclassified Streptomyces TaxID=2593676 RepID=UPI0038054F3E
MADARFFNDEPFLNNEEGPDLLGHGRSAEHAISLLDRVGSRRGPRRRRPAKLHGDKGYDYDHLRRWLRSRNITPRIAREGIESCQRLGGHRWTVERTVEWLTGCRRLHRRYERKAEHFLAFASIAATLICFRRLGR